MQNRQLYIHVVDHIEEVAVNEVCLCNVRIVAGHGQEQYSGRLWYSNEVQLLRDKVCQEYPPHPYTTTTNHNVNHPSN